MPSAQLEAHAARDVPEARIRELALAKVKASKAYTDHLYTSTKNFTDDELVDYELRLVALRKVMNAASFAFDKAV